ncbi:TPA: YadA-like family protein [Haemophilus influenzae]
MNLIFKIIWNKTTQRLEIVSELAKGAVKASSTSSSTSSSEKNNKTLPISILATLVTSILASSVSYAAKINYEDIPKQGVAIVYDADSGILRNMSLEGTESLGVLSATDAVHSLNRMLERYKGFVHVNSEGNKANKTGIWADWLTAQTSKVQAETKNSGGLFSDNLGKFTEKSGAQGSRSVAVGVYANALAADSIAIGSRANVNNYWGNQYREALNGIAIGRQAQVEGATNSIAFGTNAKLLASTPYSLKPDNSIAIGNNSTVNWASNAITLGNNASITGSHAVSGVWKGSDNSIAIGNETTVGREDTVAIGSSVNAQRENTVAIGTNVTAKRENSVVIGQNAKGERERVVAIGAHATAGGDRTVAIGPEATANGSKSIVIGGVGDTKNNKAKSESGANQAIVIGNGAQAKAAASYSITLGNSAKTEAATGISIGDRANVASGANNGIALGQSAVANNSGDIAIGKSSSTSTKHAVSDMKIGDITLSKGVVATDNGTVSFGNENVKRQIQNVGAGEISENSSDAITGSQLYSVIKATDEIAKTTYTFKVNGQDVKVMQNKAASATNNANNTLDFKASDGLEVDYENGAVTYKLNAESKKSIADAKAAAKTVSDKLVEIDQSVQRAETAAQTASDKADEANSSAEKAKASENAAATSAQTASDKADEANSSAEKAKASENAAATSAQTASDKADEANSSAEKAKDSENTVKMIKDRIEGSGLISADGKTSFASNNESNRESAKASGKDSTAMGYGSEAKGDHSTALGNNAKAHADRSTAIGHNAEAKAVGSVALGEGSVAKEENTISVGDVGHERRITNVQDPKNLTDAANKRYVDYSVNSVRNELKQTDRKLRGGIAGVVAMANIPTTNRAGRTMIGVGVGNFKGQNAVAVGLSKSSDNNRIHFKVSGSATSAGDYAIGGGIGYQW